MDIDQEVNPEDNPVINLEINPEYNKVVSAVLLPEIFRYLPRDDQLVARKVNLDFAEGADLSLKWYSEGAVKIRDNERMERFLADFPTNDPPMSMVSLIPVYVNPSCVTVQNLEKFGRVHGTRCRKLEITFPPEVDESMDQKGKLLLKELSHVQNLVLRTSMTLLEDPSIMEPVQIEIGLPVFTSLSNLDIDCVSSQSSLLLDIVQSAPSLRRVNVKLCESQNRSPATEQFLNRMGHVRIQVLSIRLNLLVVTEADSLLSLVSKAKLNPKAADIFLDIELPPEKAIEEMDSEERAEKSRNDAALAHGINLLSDWLSCLREMQRLEYLYVRCTMNKVIKVPFPEFPYLKALNIGATSKDENFWNLTGQVLPSNLLFSSMIPILETLVIGDQLVRFCGPPFTRITTLVIEDSQEFQTIRTSAPFEHSHRWKFLFPNLVSLDTFVVIGEEDTLEPVLKELTNLTHLCVSFRVANKNQNQGRIWNIFTGSLNYMDNTTPDDVVIPIHPIIVDNPNPDEVQTSSLINLTRLRVLELRDTPPAVLVAVVHLSAIGLLPVYDLLKVAMNRKFHLVPKIAYRQSLQIHHTLVEV